MNGIHLEDHLVNGRPNLQSYVYTYSFRHKFGYGHFYFQSFSPAAQIVLLSFIFPEEI